ncbi:MAG: hypothetical protein GX799_05280 [Crenarchaeota archaeon]|jgi:hypothetical protein|nr:hypothetical protein [Thermoproteota archaeon]
MLSTIFAGLKSSFNSEKPLIEREILQLLYKAGSAGLLPKAMQARLERFKVSRYQ